MRRTLAPPAVLAAALAATGWLYLLRPALPGPRLGGALPLDALARASSAPLLWYLVVWAAAAALLGVYARWARIDRLTAALLIGLAVGVWTYLADGVSIAVVQQIPAHDAFDQALKLKAVYLAGGVVALGVAAVAEARHRGRSAVPAIAGVVFLAGALNLLYTMLPGRQDGLLPGLTPDALWPLARATRALTGVALVLAARGLARRRHRAWVVALAVSALATALHVLHGVDDGSIPSALVLVLLVARRHDFDRPGDEATRALPLRRAAVSVATILAYGSSALWLNRMVADQPFSARFALDEILRGVLGLHAGGSPHLADGFGQWYPLSLLLLGVAAIAWIVAGWLAPWRHRVRQEAHEREVARALVHAWGDDTLAPFVLRADKSYFFDEDEVAFLAYRVVNGVAVVSGDPVGPDGRFDALVGAFVAHARERDWRIAILGASERLIELYRAHGLHALYHGDEAVVDTAAFSLEGRAIRKVRQSVHRLEKAGFAVRVLRPSEIGAELREELEAITVDWRAGRPERGFAMALDVLFGLGDGDAIFVVGFDADGQAGGFLHFAIAPAAGALSLSSMPRRQRTPNGFNEWLVCETIAWARAHGYGRVSLNFAPFAALLAPEAELTAVQGVQRRALLGLKGHFQLDNLLAFNRKFLPAWERRFVVYERRRDLPRVGVAALAAEAYLPFQGKRR
ncbi:MAG TPA: phosphatidylglycerol lysyltransferase domain-containing protein [Gaiellaceae bacterium]|nr:phosphatidylglycerol lysyltransferase domain-containing protein [Gaiellaceae bacterium]